MDVLEIKVNGYYLDLYPDEKIVQTFSLFNINDITSRQAEYSNSFKVPKTNTNLQIIDYSDYINNVTTFPFRKIATEIYVNGFLFKKGLIEIEEINEDISLRFYTGNITFYDFIKQRSLKDISADNNTSLITIWNLTNVLSLRNATSGVFFPLVDYNGMAATGNSVDVRRLLPAYFKLSLIEAMCIDAGYSLVNEITGDALTAMQNDIVPTSTNKLGNNAEDIALNSYSGSMVDGTGDTDIVSFGGYHTNFTQNTTDVLELSTSSYRNANFSTYVSGNADRYFQPINNLDYFKCELTGNYDIAYNLDVNVYFYNSWDSTPVHDGNSTMYFRIQINGINQYVVGDVNVAFNNSSINGSATATLNGSQNVNLNAGDIVRLVVGFKTTISVGSFAATSVSNTHTPKYKINTASTFGVSLGSGIAFGTQINPAQCLPDIKQNDFLKDTCIRYCILPYVDEDTKTLYLKEFKSIKDNINVAPDWTAKVDETKDASLTFKLGDYAQRNKYIHKEDKSVDPLPLGTDTDFVILNENLIQEKTIYTSCFAGSITTTKLDTSEMIAIDLHDGSDFKNDVQPRCCYTRLVDRSIAYTDGTTTTAVTTNIPHTWFISGLRSYNAGWGNGLLNDYSSDLINIIQQPKVLKIDIKLTLADVLVLNYFYPIYLKQYNAFFFRSSINQYDYTSNDATEVELIKLN